MMMTIVKIELYAEECARKKKERESKSGRQIQNEDPNGKSEDGEKEKEELEKDDEESGKEVERNFQKSS